MSGLDLVPWIFGGLFPFFFVLIIVVGILAVLRERRRRERLRAYAAELGWQPIMGPAPDPVIRDMDSRRCKLDLGTRYGPYEVWLVWHQWVEHTGSGDTSSSTTRNLTRYYLWLGSSYPDISVRRRTRVGAFFKPVRGVGTGDSAFDKAFLVRPADSYAGQRLLTPQLREVMLARRLPVFEITGGVLITGYGDPPRVENLKPRADAIACLAHMLTNGG